MPLASCKNYNKNIVFAGFTTFYLKNNGVMTCHVSRPTATSARLELALDRASRKQNLANSYSGPSGQFNRWTTAAVLKEYKGNFLRDPLVDSGNGQFALFAQSVLDQFRVGERRLLRSSVPAVVSNPERIVSNLLVSDHLYGVTLQDTNAQKRVKNLRGR